MRQRDVVNLSPIVQRTHTDCVIAAVAMFIGRSYAEVFQTNQKMSRSVAKSGASDEAIRRMVRSFGADVLRVSSDQVDLDTDTGLLSLTSRTDAWHMVVLFRGVIVDPSSGLLWNPEFYFQENADLQIEYLLILI